MLKFNILFYLSLILLTFFGTLDSSSFNIYNRLNSDNSWKALVMQPFEIWQWTAENKCIDQICYKNVTHKKQ